MNGDLWRPCGDYDADCLVGCGTAGRLYWRPRLCALTSTSQKPIATVFKVRETPCVKQQYSQNYSSVSGRAWPFDLCPTRPKGLNWACHHTKCSVSNFILGHNLSSKKTWFLVALPSAYMQYLWHRKLASNTERLWHYPHLAKWPASYCRTAHTINLGILECI